MPCHSGLTPETVTYVPGLFVTYVPGPYPTEPRDTASYGLFNRPGFKSIGDTNLMCVS
jgi:hypothetical protein